MLEIIILICSLFIIIPLLLIGAVAININRTLNGKPALTTEAALVDFFKQSLLKIRTELTRVFKNNNTKSIKPKTKYASKPKNNVEDAEFREVKKS